jgi:hypothetical protein
LKKWEFNSRNDGWDSWYRCNIQPIMSCIFFHPCCPPICILSFIACFLWRVI